MSSQTCDKPEPEFAKQDTSDMSKDRSIIAKKRWRLLAKALSGHGGSDLRQSSASVRRFCSFGLLDTALTSGGDNLEAVSWYQYTCTEVPTFAMTIRHLPDLIKPEMLLGFNNTGNVCVWPAEEVMTYYCLKNCDKFRGKALCELGGGMTCLAGVALGVMSDAVYIELTDGNAESVTNLKEIVEENKSLGVFGETKLSSRLLRWGPDGVDEDLAEKFDFLLCADCLFFEEGREDLINAMDQMLKPGGEVIIFAPKRGKTFDKFVSLAEETFTINMVENYDNKVFDIHCKMQNKGHDYYDANIHYPLLLLLHKEER